MAVGAAQTSVEVSLPRNVAAGDRFSLTVTVNNPEGRVADIAAPTLSGCTFLGGPGVSTSSYTSIINGRMQSSKSTGYTFTYQADKEGTVKVPQIDVTVDGKSYSTQPGQFTVMAASQSRQRQGGWGSPSPSRPSQGGGGTSTSSDFQVGANDLFMRVALSANNVYEQQAVECSIKLYSINGQVNSLAAASIPAFDGCLIEVIGTPSTIDWHSETVNGKDYYAATIYRALLYPQRSGDITLSGGEYNVRVYRQMLVQDFFAARPVMQEKDLTIKPHSTVLHVRA
ncbi:MAG: BatD family protein, partial [Muribaculaceae bacterium]|nr:BatD family protein [Muribaculaceae bacterium]